MNAAPEDIAKLSGAINNCDGAAGKMAATMQNNLKGQLTVLKSQAEELAIGFGTELMPVAQDLVGLASSAVQGFSGLNDGTKKFIVYAGLAAAGPLTTGIGSVTSGVGSMITTLGGAATAFTAAGGGAAGLGAAMYFFVVAVAHCVDVATGASGVLQSIAIGVLIANEGISILENCAKCGIPIPERLLRALEQIRGRDEKQKAKELALKTQQG